MEKSIATHNANHLRFWLAVAVSTGCTVLAVSCICVVLFALAERSHIGTAEDLRRSVDLEASKTVVLGKTLADLTDLMRYQVCSNRHSVIIPKTFLTGILPTARSGYVVSSWDQSSGKTSVHFLSAALSIEKECLVSVSGVAIWESHRLFRSAQVAETIVLYSAPSLFFVRRDDCSVHKVLTSHVGAVLSTGVVDEYLVAYGSGTVQVGLVKNGALGWTREVAEGNYAVGSGDAAMVRLGDGRYAVSYVYLPSGGGVGTFEPVCVAVIELGRDHTKVSDVKITKMCTSRFVHCFGFAETDLNTLVGLCVDPEMDLHVVEVCRTFNSRLRLRKIMTPLSDFGGAHRVAGKYIFAAHARLSISTCLASAFVYDYAHNNITTTAGIINECTARVSGEASQHGNGMSVYTISTSSGFAVIHASREGARVVFARNGTDAGFQFMAAAGDGGYVVHVTAPRGEENKVWKFYPWMAGSYQDEKLNCTGVM